MFAVLIHWWVEVLLADRTTSMCIWTTTEPRVRLLQRKTGLRPRVIYYWSFQCDAYVLVYSNCQCSFAFCLSLTLITVQFIQDSLLAICSKRAVPLAFHLCCFYFSAVLIVGVPFPFWCLGQDVEFGCNGSWLLPFYLLFNNLQQPSYSLRRQRWRSLFNNIFALKGWPGIKHHSLPTAHRGRENQPNKTDIIHSVAALLELEARAFFTTNMIQYFDFSVSNNEFCLFWVSRPSQQYYGHVDPSPKEMREKVNAYIYCVNIKKESFLQH